MALDQGTGSALRHVRVAGKVRALDAHVGVIDGRVLSA
jgi:hypothetical protein